MIGAVPDASAGRAPDTVITPDTGPDAAPDRAPRGVMWFATTVFILSTGAFVTVLLDGSSPVVLGLWIVAYLVAGAVLLDGALRERRTVTVPLALVAFLALAAASVLWSAAPEVTLRRSIGLGGTVLIGLVLAQRLRPVAIFDAMRRAVLVIAVVSLLFYLSGDARALDEVHDTLRGVVATKNTLGRVMGLGLLACAATAFIDRGRLRLAIGSAVPMVVALALTGSTGGAIIAVLVLLMMAAAMLWRSAVGRHALLGTAATVSGVFVLVAQATSAEAIVGLVGRDLTLTGRTRIWALSAEAFAQQPLLGYGYGTFWHEAGPTAGRRIVALLYWSVPNAHNGLLDVALDVGVVGVVLAVLIIGGLLIRGIGDARAGRHEVAVLRLSIALLVVFSNLVESSFLQENVFLTIAFVAALAAREPPAPDATG